MTRDGDERRRPEQGDPVRPHGKPRAAAGAGWLLASSRIVEASPVLEWHRWLGLMAAIAAITAALMTGQIDPPGKPQRLYRIALFSAAAIVAVAGHFGALLVWGADFLRP